MVISSYSCFPLLFAETGLTSRGLCHPWAMESEPEPEPGGVNFVSQLTQIRLHRAKGLSRLVPQNLVVVLRCMT